MSAATTRHDDAGHGATCSEPGCVHPARFRVLVTTGPAQDDAATRTSGTCGTHLVDTIQRLAGSAYERRRDPAYVTVYAVAEAHAEGPGSAVEELALGTFPVPG
ncbi:hypothetical protein [Actinomadura rupiterrae]|uniref:hypothetical protein n=1 Tax=Actinomadura rupiterrae TaxID=559627 RepID=UPI0020A4BB58|nr:hypothetical protein [Actinomadura rupiterrae]MCP2336108.1 hypothetical protein [Actinomadura rupiterrae]